MLFCEAHAPLLQSEQKYLLVTEKFNNGKLCTSSVQVILKYAISRSQMIVHNNGLVILTIDNLKLRL